jgi:hypothetical protein
MSKEEEGRAAASHHALGSPFLGPAPHHPANIPGECHPLACPLLLGAGAAATQRVPSHDAWEQDEGGRTLSGGRGSEEGGLVPQNQGVDHQGLEEDRADGEGVSRKRGLTRTREIRALQAVAAGGGKAALREAALAAGQHSSWSYNTRWGLFPKPAV